MKKIEKKYIKPKKTAVTLSSEQAVLQICVIGGAYLGGTASTRCFGSGGFGTCNCSVKGKQEQVGAPINNQHASS